MAMMIHAYIRSDVVASMINAPYTPTYRIPIILTIVYSKFITENVDQELQLQLIQTNGAVVFTTFYLVFNHRKISFHSHLELELNAQNE